MQEAVRVRIEAIRFRVGEERARISLMSAARGDDLRHMLMSAASILDDVEYFFLAASVLQEERSAAQWRYWLSNAEIVLKRAVEQRLQVQRLAEKFGANSRLI